MDDKFSDAYLLNIVPLANTGLFAQLRPSVDKISVAFILNDPQFVPIQYRTNETSNGMFFSTKNT
jgi:hypothetical protein